MNEIQIMTLSLLLFIANRIVSPANERDMKALKIYQDYLSEIVKVQQEVGEGE